MKKYLLYTFLLLVMIITYFVPKEKTVVMEETKTEVLVTDIMVDVKGAVLKPGVYLLKEGSRVSDAIKMSGGTTKEAALKFINLSMLLEDEMVVYIYSNKELVNKEACPAIEPETCPVIECPRIENPVCNVPLDNKISINMATQAELETLPGIGATKALDIIKYRNDNNGFKDINELKKVSGIGDATFNNLKDFIKL